MTKDPAVAALKADYNGINAKGAHVSPRKKASDPRPNISPRKKSSNKKKTFEAEASSVLCDDDILQPESGKVDSGKVKQGSKKKIVKRISRLPPGVVFTSFKGNEFKVVDLIGAGGFGEVHRVLETNSNVEYALKTEASRDTSKESRLKIEVLVFKAIDKQFERLPERCTHFIRMIDCGMTENLKFMVMTCTGPNLEDIRSSILKTDFSFKSALMLSIATCESLSDFHELGYVHRDVKPTNFVVGKKPDTKVVYILDFGMAQRFDKKTDRPAKVGKFEGTIRYASRACHLGHVVWPKDDYESWLFACVEFFQKKCLPWRRVTDKAEVLVMKRNFFRHQYNRCYAVCPKEFAQLVRFVDELGEAYTDAVDTTYFLETLNKVRKKHKIERDALYDWEETSETRKNERKLEPRSSAVDGSEKQRRKQHPEEESAKDLNNSGRKKKTEPRHKDSGTVTDASVRTKRSAKKPPSSNAAADTSERNKKTGTARARSPIDRTDSERRRKGPNDNTKDTKETKDSTEAHSEKTRKRK
uniref:non-specific serine/threonine protein kinase n=1 Tax=Panagrellus redivivus TaxID=6233 RepID=A0A7E4UZH3_PANRE